MTGPNRLTPASQIQYDLNGGSTCFLCLSQSTSPEKFSLRSVYRYLKINIKNDIKGRNIRGGDENGQAVFCNQCATIIQPLSKLCTELELLQMRVHHYLKSVNELLEKSQSTQDSINQENVTITETDYGYVEFIKLMKNKLQQKCQVNLSQAVPQVMVTNDSLLLLKYKTEPIDELESSESCFTNTSTPPVSDDDDNGDDEFESDSATSESEIAKESFECRTRKNRRSNVLKHRKMQHKPKVTAFQCDNCGKYFSQSSSLFRHKRMIHQRPAGTLVRHTKRSLEKNTAENSNAATAMSTMDIQTVEKPTSTGVQSDDEISQDETDQSSSFEPFVKDPNSKYGTCNLCHPPRLVHGTSVRLHKIIYHLDYWFISSKQSGVTQQQFKKYCLHVLKVQLLSCATLSDEKGNSLAKCPHCPYKASPLKNMYLLRRHVCRVHKEIFAVQLEKVQRSTTLDELKAFKTPPDVNFSLPQEEPKSKTKRQGQHKCDLCDRIFSRFGRLSKHKLRVHEYSLVEKDMWKCNVCGMKFIHPSSLHMHQVKTHKMNVNTSRKTALEMDPTRTCNVCGIKFKNVARLKGHMYIEHSESIPRCDICDKEFLSSENLSKHKKMKHGNNSSTGSRVGKGIPITFKCGICKLEFAHSSTLSMHKRNKHGIGIKCNECGNFFAHSRGLSQHKTITHDKDKEKRKDVMSLPPVKMVKMCDVCGKTYQRADNLFLHKRRVHGIDPYETQCDHCGKKFRDSRRLLKHIQTAHGRKDVPEIEKLKSTENSNAADAFSMSTQSKNSEHPIVLSNVEYLDDHQVDGGIDFDNNVMGDSVSEEQEIEFHLPEENTNANGDEFEDHSAGDRGASEDFAGKLTILCNVK